MTWQQRGRTRERNYDIPLSGSSLMYVHGMYNSYMCTKQFQPLIPNIVIVSV